MLKCCATDATRTQHEARHFFCPVRIAFASVRLRILLYFDCTSPEFGRRHRLTEKYAPRKFIVLISLSTSSGYKCAV